MSLHRRGNQCVGRKNLIDEYINTTTIILSSREGQTENESFLECNNLETEDLDGISGSYVFYSFRASIILSRAFVRPNFFVAPDALTLVGHSSH